MKQKVPAMVELIEKLLDGASGSCMCSTVYDSSFHLARTEERSLMPACRSTMRLL